MSETEVYASGEIERYTAGQVVKLESVDLAISMDELYDFLINEADV